MKSSDHTFGFLAEIKETIEQNINARLELLKLESAARGAKLVAAFSLALLAGGILFFVLLFVSLMAGYLCAHYTGSMFAGFGLVASFYLVLFVVLWAMRKKLATIIADKVVESMFDD